jgi:hypothetical protein
MSNFWPDIYIEEITFASGKTNLFSGIATDGTLDGTDSDGVISAGSPYYKGRVQFYAGGTKGGLIPVSAQGNYINSISLSDSEGITSRIRLYLNEDLYPDDTTVETNTLLFDSDYSGPGEGGRWDGTDALTWKQMLSDMSGSALGIAFPVGTFIQPGAHLKVVTTGTLTSGTLRLEVRFGGGWGIRTFQTNVAS